MNEPKAVYHPILKHIIVFSSMKPVFLLFVFLSFFDLLCTGRGTCGKKT